MNRGVFFCLAVWLAFAAAPARAQEAPNAGDRTATRPGGYLRPSLGWGWPVLSEADNVPSRYGLGWGVAGGLVLSRLSVGAEFNYFNGTRFDGRLATDPTIQGRSRTNAFRLGLDLGYDLVSGRLTFRPRCSVGAEWRRTAIGDSYVSYRRATFWAPGLLALVSLRKDGLFAVGLDVRWNMILIDGSLDQHFSGSLAFESRF